MSSTAVAEEIYRDVRGTRVRIQKAGDGPPLLYLTGSEPSSTWADVHSALAESYTVYLPDHPGFGFSDDDERIDTIHDMTFFYLDLLDDLEIPRVTLVGTSLGGWMAADIASTDSQVVERLVLIDACGIHVDGVHVPDWYMLSAEEQATRLFHSPEMKEQALEQAQQPPADEEEFRLVVRASITDAHLGWNPLYHDPKLSNRLHRIKAPTLIVWGREDEVIPLGIGEGFQRLIPGARLEVIDGAGHIPQMEQLEAFLSILNSFLSEGS